MRYVKSIFCISISLLLLCIVLVGCGSEKDDTNRWLFGHTWGETKNESKSKITEDVDICGYRLNENLAWGDNIDYRYTDSAKMNQIIFQLTTNGDTREKVLTNFVEVLGEPYSSENISYETELYASEKTSDLYTWYEDTIKYSVFIGDEEISVYIFNDAISD